MNTKRLNQSGQKASTKRLQTRHSCPLYLHQVQRNPRTQRFMEMLYFQTLKQNMKKHDEVPAARKFNV
uniref:Uncharacterized protein n=1 Tax=Daucus carota subsp. sativus TaxID=79200 RepID=A0A175YNL2_DAUCS